jgi:hypothetical protein
VGSVLLIINGIGWFIMDIKILFIVFGVRIYRIWARMVFLEVRPIAGPHEKFFTA